MAACTAGADVPPQAHRRTWKKACLESKVNLVVALMAGGGVSRDSAFLLAARWWRPPPVLLLPLLDGNISTQKKKKLEPNCHGPHVTHGRVNILLAVWS